jgi:DivIVA domain-containing protein
MAEQEKSDHGKELLQAVWSSSGPAGAGQPVEDGDSVASTAEADLIESKPVRPQFSLVWRGYSPDDVDDYLAKLHTEMRILARAAHDGKSNAQRLLELQRELSDAGVKLEDAERLAGQAQQLRGEAARARQLEQELAYGRDRIGMLERRLEEALLEPSASPPMAESSDAETSDDIRTSIAEMVEAAELKTEQIRREVVEEAQRQLEEGRAESKRMLQEAEAEAGLIREEARVEAQRLERSRDEVIGNAEMQARTILDAARGEGEELRREAHQAAAALRKDAVAEAERARAQGDAALSEAVSEAQRVLGGAAAEARRSNEESAALLRRAKADVERMLAAAVSRRDLVMAEVTTIRARLAASVKLLDSTLETTRDATPAGRTAEGDQARAQRAVTDEKPVPEPVPSGSSRRRPSKRAD